ncbi:MAG: MFS transporter [Frankiaceae bacterium]
MTYDDQCLPASPLGPGDRVCRLVPDVLDNTVVSVALANIRADIPSGVTDLEWVVNGYALTFAAFMLAGGTLGDLYGRKKVMMGGIAVFCAGSVVCAVADDSPMLIIGRAVMGVGAAASRGRCR